VSKATEFYLVQVKFFFVHLWRKTLANTILKALRSICFYGAELTQYILEIKAKLLPAACRV
jgi:hypothetical protein